MMSWHIGTPANGASGSRLTPARSETSECAGVRRNLRTAVSRLPLVRRLRVERGQAAVEFAMVVPLLCLVIIAILHFGKVMNYWLDLNHVASEGARKAAVNTFDSDAEYDAYLRTRLETGELRAGGTASIPNPSTINVCLPEGSDVGDPVTVQVAAGYSLPFIGATVTLRGSATMRLEQPAEFAGTGACV
jgi:Flp pilus assembly protein TadG